MRDFVKSFSPYLFSLFLVKIFSNPPSNRRMNYIKKIEKNNKSLTKLLHEFLIFHKIYLFIIKKWWFKILHFIANNKKNYLYS